MAVKKTAKKAAKKASAKATVKPTVKPTVKASAKAAPKKQPAKKAKDLKAVKTVKAVKAVKVAKATRPVAAAKRGALKMSEVSPGFTANDLEKSLAWYRDVLGFVVEGRWEKDGKLAGVELRAGDIIFMLGQDDWMKGRDRKKGEGFRLYCTTNQDVDALAAGIVARGGTLDQEPRDQHWGMRDFALTDPDGFKITIAKELKKR